jgi:hypothetical protein
LYVVGVTVLLIACSFKYHELWVLRVKLDLISVQPTGGLCGL